MPGEDSTPSLFDQAAPRPADYDGIARWRAERARLLQAQAQILQLPVGRLVRVEFASGDPLEGRLEFAQELLFWDRQHDRHPVRLRIGQDCFLSSEILSWIALD